MKIRAIYAAGLRGATPAGGWSNEIRPDDCVHTLIAVHTDEGLTGLGSVFSNDGRVSAAVDEAIVRAAREAIGAQGLLMVDPGASDAFWPQGYKWALRTAQMLVAYDVTWFEEPLRPDALDDFVALRRAAPVPIAGGEVLTRRQAFTPWLQAGAFDIVQPDVTKVGGLSESRRIGWLAEACGVKLIP